MIIPEWSGKLKVGDVVKHKGLYHQEYSKGKLRTISRFRYNIIFIFNNSKVYKN